MKFRSRSYPIATLAIALAACGQLATENPPVVTGSPPSPPDAPSLTLGHDSVILQWEAPADSRVDGYVVSRSFRRTRAGRPATSETPDSFVALATIPYATLSYIDADLVTNATYAYRLAAFNAISHSDPSAPVSVTIPEAYPISEASPTICVENPESPRCSHPDTIVLPPETYLANPATTVSSVDRFTVEFSSSENDTGFICTLDPDAPDASPELCSSPKNFFDLSDGAHVIEVRAVSADGREDPTPSRLSIWVDTMVPEVTLTGMPATEVATGTVTFTFLSNEPVNSLTFECEINFTREPCTSPYTITLVSGFYAFDVYVYDRAMNRAHLASPYSFEVDTLPPVLTVILAPPAQTNAIPQNINYVSSKYPIAVACALDGVPYTPCGLSNSLNATPGVAHTFTVVATDEAGRPSIPMTTVFTVDVDPPDTAFAPAPPPATQAVDQSYGLASTTDGNATFQCRFAPTTVIATAPFTLCASPFQRAGSTLAHGEYTFEARSIDTAGNVDPSPVSARIFVITRPSNVYLTSSPNAFTNTTSAAFTFVAEWQPIGLMCVVDAGAPASCDGGNYAVAGLAEGQHTFEVWAVDTFGGEGPHKTVGWVVDTTPPATPAGLTAVSGDPITVQWQTGAGTKWYRIWYSALGSPGDDTDALEGASGWSQLLADTTLTFPGFSLTRRIAVSAIDSAGNESPRSAAVTAHPTGWTYSNTGLSGSIRAIAGDANGFAYALTSAPDGSLYFSSNTASTWQSGVPVATAALGVKAGMAVIGSTAHIAYAASDGSLMHAFGNLDGFSTEVVDGGNDALAGASIAADANGKLHALYASSSAGKLYYADDITGSWSIATADTSAGNFLDPDVAANGGMVWAGYFESGSADLRALSFDGTTLSAATLRTDNSGYQPSAAVTADGSPSLAYFNQTRGAISVATKTSGNWQFEDVHFTSSVQSLGIGIGPDGWQRLAFVLSGSLRLKERGDTGWTDQTTPTPFLAGLSGSMVYDSSIAGHQHLLVKKTDGSVWHLNRYDAP